MNFVFWLLFMASEVPLEGLQLIISRRSINNHIEFNPLQSAILHSN